MPDRNGLELYNHFPNPHFKVVIITAYSQYAIEAIKKSATDYLLKPVSFMELQESLYKISRILESEKQQEEIEDRLSFCNAPEIQGVKIVFDVESGFILLDTRGIEYCFADQSYSIIVTNTGKNITISKPLKELQEMLPAQHFYRTHKSYLVNIFYVRKFVRASESFVQLKCGIKIPVSVRNTAKIKNDIKQMLTI
jgi:two-component system LytT family response regulator